MNSLDAAKILRKPTNINEPYIDRQATYERNKNLKDKTGVTLTLLIKDKPVKKIKKIRGSFGGNQNPHNRPF